MLSLELPCWLALSKVTWPHLLLACSKLNPGWLADTNQKTRAQFFLLSPTQSRTDIHILTIMHGVPRRGELRRHVCAQFIQMSVSHGVRDQISSCFLHTRSARRIARRTLPNPLPSPWQQGPTSTNQNPSPSISPGNCRSARSFASAHAIHIFLPPFFPASRERCFHFYLEPRAL